MIPKKSMTTYDIVMIFLMKHSITKQNQPTISSFQYQLTSVDCSIDNLVVRVGKGAIHTLHCTAEAWKQILVSEQFVIIRLSYLCFYLYEKVCFYKLAL